MKENNFIIAMKYLLFCDSYYYWCRFHGLISVLNRFPVVIVNTNYKVLPKVMKCKKISHWKENPFNLLCVKFIVYTLSTFKEYRTQYQPAVSRLKVITFFGKGGEGERGEGDSYGGWKLKGGMFVADCLSCPVPLAQLLYFYVLRNTLI